MMIAVVLLALLFAAMAAFKKDENRRRLQSQSQSYAQTATLNADQVTFYEEMLQFEEDTDKAIQRELDEIPEANRATSRGQAALERIQTRRDRLHTMMAARRLQRDYYKRLKSKYERLASEPTLPCDPDPSPPNAPVLGPPATSPGPQRSPGP